MPSVEQFVPPGQPEPTETVAGLRLLGREPLARAIIFFGNRLADTPITGTETRTVSIATDQSGQRHFHSTFKNVRGDVVATDITIAPDHNGPLPTPLVTARRTFAAEDAVIPRFTGNFHSQSPYQNTITGWYAFTTLFGLWRRKPTA